MKNNLIQLYNLYLFIFILVTNVLSAENMNIETTATNTLKVTSTEITSEIVANFINNEIFINVEEYSKIINKCKKLNELSGKKIHNYEEKKFTEILDECNKLNESNNINTKKLFRKSTYSCFTTRHLTCIGTKKFRTSLQAIAWCKRKDPIFGTLGKGKCK